MFHHKNTAGKYTTFALAFFFVSNFGDGDGNDDERDDEAPIVVSKVFSVEKGSALMDPLRH